MYFFNFACIFEEIGNKFKISFDINIVHLIYTFYYEYYKNIYHKYSLFYLAFLLQNRKSLINTKLNKRELIDILIKEEVHRDIALVHSNICTYTPYVRSIKKQINPSSRSRSLIYSQTIWSIFIMIKDCNGRKIGEFKEWDKVTIRGEELIIWAFQDVKNKKCQVILKNVKDHRRYIYQLEDFVRELEDDDVIYEH